MRIGFDARMIDHPGIGRYIRNLLAVMITQAKNCEFVLFGDRKKLTAFKQRVGIASPSFAEPLALLRFGAGLPSPIGGEGKEAAMTDIVEWDALVYSIQEHIGHPFAKYNLDIVHVPHFNVPYWPQQRLVVTIHDLIYLKFPESAPLSKRMAMKLVVSKAAERADKITAVSENTKKDIIERYPEAAGKIEVIYEAADPIFRKIDDEDKKNQIKQKYNLPDDIILFVGSLKKHKNIERLIDAYVYLRSKGIKHRLVIAGRYDQREEMISDKIKAGGVIYLNELSEDELPVLYNLASVFVMPSLYEGFGLPVLEAFASGVPVCSSNAASLPEVVGDAGLLFNPYNIKDICDKIYQVLSNEGLREQFIQKGLERVKTFSWEKTAKQTLEVYEKVAGCR